MDILSLILSFAHIVGLALGVGAATVKLRLLLKCHTDLDYVPIFLGVVRPITMIIIVGQILLTLSGIGWMLTGYPFRTIIIVKIILLAFLWVLGPTIDKVFEPKFERLAPYREEGANSPFAKAMKQFLVAEILATGLFYTLLILGVLV